MEKIFRWPLILIGVGIDLLMLVKILKWIGYFAW